KFLPDMINYCNHHEPEIRMKAVVTLQLLSRNEENKSILVEEQALEVLVGLLKAQNNREYTHRYAAIALCDLISGNDDRKLKIVELGSEPKKIEDELNIDNLAELTRSDNLSLRNSAIRILLDRAMS
ncbi:14621_t:CDS:2, partial [Acaulospora morrowiae]